MHGILQQILVERLGNADYEVWISSNWADWELMESKGKREGKPPIFGEEHALQYMECKKEGRNIVLAYIPYESNICVAIRAYRDQVFSTQELVELSTLLYPYYSETVARKHERALNEIMNSIRGVTQLLDLNELLERILASALSVIPYECIGVLWRYDPSMDALTVRARAGEMGEGMLRMRLKPGEGIIGSTFLRGTPRLYTEWSIVEDDFGNMTNENKQHLHSAYHFDNICSIISVPIKVEGKPACVLIVYQKGKVPLFTEADVRLLQSFADQVAIAITNAQLYENLSMQNETLIRRDEIHASLMRLSLQNKGTGSIVSELIRVIGMPLTFVDFIDHEWLPKRGEISNEWSIERLRTLYSTLRQPEVLTVIEDSESASNQYLYPIASANQCLGYLIMELHGKLEPLQLMALEQGSSILALELMRKQSLAEFYFKKTQQFFNDLRLSRDSGDYWEKADEVGIGPTTSIVVGLLEFAEQVSPSALSTMMVQLISHLREKMPAGTLPIAFGSERRMTVLLKENGTQPPNRLEQRLGSLVHAWESRNQVSLYGGWGSIRTGLDAINTSYQEADKALAYQRARSAGGMIHYTDIGVNRLFIRQPAEDLDAFMAEIFEPLRPASGQAGGLEETLMAYMSCGGSATKAAASLHIHINTLYQRMHKIEEVLGMSLANQEHMLHLQLACYLRQTYGN